jgi:hypothetical protein
MTLENSMLEKILASFVQEIASTYIEEGTDFEVVERTIELTLKLLRETLAAVKEKLLGYTKLNDGRYLFLPTNRKDLMHANIENGYVVSVREEGESCILGSLEEVFEHARKRVKKKETEKTGE